MDDALPFARTWWIEPGRAIGGRFPGTTDPAEGERMLGLLLDAGVRLFVNLQEPGELGGGGRPFPDYAPAVARLAAARGVTARIERCAIADMGVPADDAAVARAIAAIDALPPGERAYVHCWGGHGRTGTFAGCWMVGRGIAADAAFARIAAARAHDAHLCGYPSPQTDAQRAFVRAWAGRRGATIQR